MTILGLECSSDHRGAALIREGRVLATAVQQDGRHTEIFRLIDAVLSEAGVPRRGIDVIAVGIGPGSYTGIRLAISAAQGWQLAAGLRVVAVDSFAALAAGLATRGESGRLILAADAQRQECAVVEAVNGELAGPVRLVSHAELRERIGRKERVVGPGIRGLVGGEDAFPSAGMTALIAERAPVFVPAEGLAPVYLREASFVKAPPARVIEGMQSV